MSFASTTSGERPGASVWRAPKGGCLVEPRFFESRATCDQSREICSSNCSTLPADLPMSAAATSPASAQSAQNLRSRPMTPCCCSVSWPYVGKSRGALAGEPKCSQFRVIVIVLMHRLKAASAESFVAQLFSWYGTGMGHTDPRGQGLFPLPAPDKSEWQNDVSFPPRLVKIQRRNEFQSTAARMVDAFVPGGCLPLSCIFPFFEASAACCSGTPRPPIAVSRGTRAEEVELGKGAAAASCETFKWPSIVSRRGSDDEGSLRPPT